MIFSRDLKHFPVSFKNVVLALGVFDGTHLGHRKIITQAVKDAKRMGIRSAVMTFEKSPQKILHPDYRPAALTTFQQKLSLLESLGVDLCLVPRFTPRFSLISAQEFVEDILIRKLGVRKVILGQDARFGYHREGNPDFMRQAAAKHKFAFTEIKSYLRKKRAVKSTLIRRLIADGDLALARDFLGRHHAIEAKVIKGKRRGGKMGFPTANLDFADAAVPPHGVYAVTARPVVRKVEKVRPRGWSRLLPEKKPLEFWQGVLNWGIRPTFENQAKQVMEVHFLEQKKLNLYGQTVEICFIKKIRDEKKFDDYQALVKQITKDIRSARRILTT